MSDVCSSDLIGTGIFVLTAEAAQKAGPGMMFSFIIAGFVCAVAALCYSELSSMVPVSSSAYPYTYAVMGELLAWLVRSEARRVGKGCVCTCRSRWARHA